MPHFLSTIEPVLHYQDDPVITPLLDFFHFPHQQPDFAACGSPTHRIGAGQLP